MKTRILFALLAATLFLSAPAFADPPVRKVTVVGTAIIKVVPDEMNWTVQESVCDATQAKAKARHDASLAAALKYIKALGDAVKDLQTGGINFAYNLYPGDSSFAKKNPFSCSTQFTFTLTDFDKYGPIADTLSKLDGIQVQSVDYSTSKEAQVRRDALKRAMLDGHDKANDLALTAGCTIDKPLTIDEQEAFYVQPETTNAAYSAASPGSGTPSVVAGQIEISAKVIVAYDLIVK